MSGHSQVRWTLRAIGPSASNHKLDGQVAAIHRVDLVSEPAIFKVACQSDRVMVGQPCRPFVFCIGTLRVMKPEGARTCAPWIQVVASRVPPPQARGKSPKHYPTNLWQPAGRWAGHATIQLSMQAYSPFKHKRRGAPGAVFKLSLARVQPAVSWERRPRVTLARWHWFDLGSRHVLGQRSRREFALTFVKIG